MSAITVVTSDSTLEEGIPQNEYDHTNEPKAGLGQRSLEPSEQAPTYPEGGREAWIVIFGAWLAVFVSFGFLNAFGGDFQAYYKIHQLADKSDSDIAWIGSVQTFCIYFMGSVFGSIFDKHGAGRLIFVGGICFSFACMMQSLCKQYWQFFLTQGLLQGICMSALFSPSFACVNHWFSKRRGFAVGVVTSGSSIGGVVWPIAVDHLITSVGYGWALRICGFISLFLTVIASFLVKGRLPPRTGSQFFALHLFRKPAYLIFGIGMSFTLLGIFFLIFYLPSYGAMHGFDSNMVFYSTSILNAASFFGRVLPGLLSDTWGRYNLLISTDIMSSILVFASIAAKDTASILVVGALYGFTSGNVVSLQGACVPPLLDDPSTIGVGIGQMLSVSGIGALLGPPIAGWLIAFNGYKSAQIFAGVMIAAGSCLLIITRTLLSKPGARLII